MSVLENTLLGRHAHGFDARDDAEREQTELHGAPDEAARAGNHLALGQFQEGGRERHAGDEHDQGGDHRAQTGLGHVVLDHERRESSHAEGGEEGHEHLERAPSAPEPLKHADESTQQRRRNHVPHRWMKDERDPDRQRHVPEHAGYGSEAVVEPSNLLELRDARRCSDLPLFSTPGEEMDGRDLIEPRCPRKPRRRLDRRRPPLPQCQEERGRQSAETSIAQSVRASDLGEPQLHGVDSFANRAQRRAEAGKKDQQLVLGRLLRQPTEVFVTRVRRGRR